jgi:hypothetical protein
MDLTEGDMPPLLLTLLTLLTILAVDMLICAGDAVVEVDPLFRKILELPSFGPDSL